MNCSLQRKSGEWDMELFPLQIILERRKAAANNGAQQASSVYPWAYAQVGSCGWQNLGAGAKLRLGTLEAPPVDSVNRGAFINRRGR